MKAAVMYDTEELPQYAEVEEPVIRNEEEQLITVTAAAIKHLDKSVASGKHYSSGQEKAKIIGGDGVGVRQDGMRVFAIGVSGMVAEKAVVEKSRTILLPAGIDDVTAAALPNAVAGSAMALRYRAALQAGETVLINGATSFTGKIAVQIAKHYGAKKIIATGRNEQTLQNLLSIGADEIVLLNQTDEELITQLKAIHQQTPIDVVIDYLWGQTAALLLQSLKGDGSFTHRTRFVSVGAITGDTISLSAAFLRSVDLQLSGSGLGSWTKPQMQALFTEILPEMFELAAAGKLQVATTVIGLEEVGNLWNVEVTQGKRLVVVIK